MIQESNIEDNIHFDDEIAYSCSNESQQILN